MATVTIQKYTGKNKTSYIVRFKDPATRKTKYYKTFQKKKDAQQSANDLRALIDNGQMKKVAKNRAKREIMTFEKVTQLLIAVWRKKLERNKLSPNTFEGYICRANVLNNVFGKKLICEILPSDITKFQDDELDRNSPASANRYLFNIKQVFKLAIEFGVIVEDPTEDIKYLSEKNHERNTFIGPVLIDRLVEASQLTRGKFYMPALIYLGAEHGSSKQESLSLTWKDIDFDFEDKGLIRFYRTKNNKERTEYIMPRSKQALLDWRDHLGYMRNRKRIKVKDTKFVFCHLDGTPLKRFDKAWRRICELIDLDDFHYHDLRHTFCSNLILSGADLKDVKEMIGHNDLAMTDRYSHLTNRHKKIRQDELAKYYRNGMCYNEVGYK
jgi:site-specific recombinase XerD